MLFAEQICARKAARNIADAAEIAESLAQEISSERRMLVPAQTVLVNHDMKVLYFRCHAFWNFNREWRRRLRQQRPLHVTVRYPHHFAGVVVQTCGHMRDVDDLSA